MTGRWLTAKDMHEARRELEIVNSRLKRGDIANPERIKKQMHVVCGCGAEGCVFISLHREEKESKSDNAI